MTNESKLVKIDSNNIKLLNDPEIEKRFPPGVNTTLQSRVNWTLAKGIGAIANEPPYASLYGGKDD